MEDERKLEILGSLDASLLEGELAREKYKKRYRLALRRTVSSLIVIAAVAALAAMLFLPVFQIGGMSMAGTLADGDIVVAVNKSSHKPGDIIAFYFNNNVLVKRVIAVSGDTVNITGDGDVYVNGSLLDEPYLDGKALGDCNVAFPYTVPDGRCFVMGDARATSVDSRNTEVGCILDGMVIGKVVFRVWPLSRIGFVK